MEAVTHETTPLTVPPHMPRTAGACGIAILCAALVVSSVPTAYAGINVWTTHGPGTAGEITALVLDPAMPGTFYATASGHVFKTTDGGGTWTAANAGLTAYVYVIAVDPTTPGTLYAGGASACLDQSGCFGSVFKSSDGGDSWAPAIRLRGVSVTALALDPTASGVLYAGTSIDDGSVLGNIFKSTDAGETWGTVGMGLPDVSFSVTALALDPAAPETLYAGVHHRVPITGGGLVYGTGTEASPQAVFKSIDAGATWSAAGAGLPERNTVSALAIDLAAPDTLYASTWYCPAEGACSGGLFKSTDGGGTWSAAGTTQVNALVIDPTTPGTLYAGTCNGAMDGCGVFKSTDGGAIWRAFNVGLTSASPVSALALDLTTPRTLYAATERGVFSIQQVATCIGNCSGTNIVAVNDLITLVNIALGTGQPAACAGGGLPLGGGVDIAVLIQAVHNALTGCGSGQ